MLPDDFSDLELDSSASVSASQQERRMRFTRLVAAIVAVLGLGSSVVFAQHALSGEAASKSTARLVAGGPDAKSTRVAAAPVVTVQDRPSQAHPPPVVTPTPAKSTKQKLLPSDAAPIVAIEDLPLEEQPPPAAAPAPAKSTKRKRLPIARAPAKSTKRKRLPIARASVKRNWDELPRTR